MKQSNGGLKLDQRRFDHNVTGKAAAAGPAHQHTSVTVTSPFASCLPLFFSMYDFSWPHSVAWSQISCGSLPLQVASPRGHSTMPCTCCNTQPDLQLLTSSTGVHRRALGVSGVCRDSHFSRILRWIWTVEEWERTKGELILGNIWCFVSFKPYSVMSEWIRFKVINCFISELDTEINYEPLWNYSLNMLPWTCAAGVDWCNKKLLFQALISVKRMRDSLIDTWEITLNLPPEKKSAALTVSISKCKYVRVTSMCSYIYVYIQGHLQMQTISAAEWKKFRHSVPSCWLISGSALLLCSFGIQNTF